MTTCKNQMIAEGIHVVPRTCPTCGVGRCTEGYDRINSPTPRVCYIVTSRTLVKNVVTMTEKEAKTMADVMEGDYEEAPLVTVS